MKKKVIWIFIALLIIGLLVYAFFWWYEYKSQQKQKISHYSLTNIEISELQEGDIILRHGYGLVSDLIVESLNEPLDISHCAVLAKDSLGKFIVIHSVSSTVSDVDGVQWQYLQPFIKDSKENSVVVVRFKGKSDEERKTIAERAHYYLNQKIPFDNSFDIYDSTEYYCNELIWHIFKDEFKVDLYKDKFAKGKFDYMKFDTFLDTTKFDVIINHFDRIKTPVEKLAQN